MGTTKEMRIKIESRDGEIRQEQTAIGHSEIVWYGSYEPGDRIVVSMEKGDFARIWIDVLIAPAVVYSDGGDFVFEVPFGRAKEAYPQEAFTGPIHQITAEYVERPRNRRILSENSLDVRESSGIFPHCTANIETRGESVFAARNTIDGLLITPGHGFWPYTSWGDGEDPNAEITIWFGRKVAADEVQIFIRSDFPHDNHWTDAVIEFSDGWEMPIHLEKTGACQRFPLSEQHLTEWVKMKKLQKDPQDPSPFPALTQWRVLGKEAD